VVIAGLRRLALLLAGTSLAVGAVGMVGALLTGDAVDRWVSVAYYLVGTVLLVLGVVAGVRGPLRPRVADRESEPITRLFGIGIATRGARRATEDERRDTHATAAILLALGLWLIVLGMIVDSSTDVV